MEEDAAVEEDVSEFERMNRLVKQLSGDDGDGDGASMLAANRRAMAGFGGGGDGLLPDMDAMWEGMYVLVSMVMLICC